MPWAGNVLTNSLKILHSTKIDFFQLNELTVINKYGKGAVVQIATLFEPVYHVACGRVLWNAFFQIIIFSPFSESLISEIRRLWGSSIFWKCSKFNVNFRNSKKKWERVCSFWENSIWIGYVKLSLLRREHLSSAVNVLTKSLKIFHRSKIDLLRLNYFRSDQ